jgi:hypothetical protein
VPYTNHTSAPASPWRDPVWAMHDAARTGQVHETNRPISITDPRGLTVALLSALLIGACFLPYYRLSLTVGAGTLVFHYKVVDHLFGSWRVFVLPGVAVLCIVLGLFNTAIKPGPRRAVIVFFALRIAVLAQLGLWVFVCVDRTSTVQVPAGAAVTTAVTWVGYVAIGVALAAVGATFATRRRGAD